ncbi:MAG TPA: hypothetical protein PK518_12865, partial [Alicycliphilus sp.]|nr:hypothetical protein [Alicycliphilus sp.]
LADRGLSVIGQSANPLQKIAPSTWRDFSNRAKSCRVRSRQLLQSLMPQGDSGLDGAVGAALGRFAPMLFY